MATCLPISGLHGDWQASLKAVGEPLERRRIALEG